jgi:hypothetical protein
MAEGASLFRPTLADYVYHRDFVGRIPSLIGPMQLCLADHLPAHPFLSQAEPIFEALREGQDLSPHVSPMKAAKTAFKKATRNGDWSKYIKMMDFLLNKWGVWHFHINASRRLVFVYICNHSRKAYVIDIRDHDRNWKIERHLIGILATNWPDSRALRKVGSGLSSLTEEDLHEAQKRGLNIPIEVSGEFYLPNFRGLMTDGSRYDGLSGIHPIAVTAKKFDQNTPNSKSIANPQIMMIGIDPAEMRPPWEVASAEMGALAAQRREIQLEDKLRNAVKASMRKIEHK